MRVLPHARQVEVARLILAGQGDRAIAAATGVARMTIRSLMTRLAAGELEALRFEASLPPCLAPAAHGATVSFAPRPGDRAMLEAWQLVFSQAGMDLIL